MPHPDLLPLSPSLPFPARSTPVPNLLLDEWMPRLSDTELRVLLIVTRQTLGFQDNGQGKEGVQGKTPTRRARDWITHYQLKQKTGRASAAVSRALDGLVQKGLLHVCTGNGTSLPTPQERRRCREKLYFSLAPPLLSIK